MRFELSGLTVGRQVAVRWLMVCLGLLPLLIIGCDKPAPPPPPLALGEGATCSLDGMLLMDFPGPKAQIHYDLGPPDLFCETREMLSIYLQPEERKQVTAIYTQDMAKASWKQPEGHWIDARQAFYVFGSSAEGSMGPAIATFATQNDAQAFIADFGGTLYRFEEVTPDMVDLRGGARHEHDD